MDYVLAAFLVADKTTISFAVGEWARIWPVQTLLKAMGAFFVRRNSGNPLYRRVLERYVNLATRAGTIARTRALRTTVRPTARLVSPFEFDALKA